jgi:SAM-dependent methyltransferase
MLRVHLSQEHDRASRRFEIIDRQVAWIHEVVLGGEPGRILDLGCGPGLHTSRLARLGHRCSGIDCSPASIEHAESEASEAGLACDYQLADLRKAELGRGFDAALLLFGEFNSFAPVEAESLLERVRHALRENGRLVLEPQTEEGVRETGEEPPMWSAQLEGLFADEPHLTLRECAWHPDQNATTERHFVFRDGEEPAVFAQTTQAYGEEVLDGMLERAGFAVIGRYESLTGGEAEGDAELFGLVAEARDPA